LTRKLGDVLTPSKNKIKKWKEFHLSTVLKFSSKGDFKCFFWKRKFSHDASAALTYEFKTIKYDSIEIYVNEEENENENAIDYVSELVTVNGTYDI
jgi:hypothetical protein